MQILFFNRKLTREEHLEPSSKHVNWVTTLHEFYLFWVLCVNFYVGCGKYMHVL